MYPHHKSYKNSTKRCHHCGRCGHIRPFCYKLYVYPPYYSQPKSKGKRGKKNQAKKVWKPKETIKCLLAHVPLGVSSRKDWYFYSGCSQHMTGDMRYIEELKLYSNSYVTFGDGTRGRIKGICKLVSPYLPSHVGVLLVVGLTANLINISQLCGQGMSVSYNKSEYIISRKDQVVLMKGSSSKDNCYMWISQSSSKVTSMKEIIYEYGVKGLPKLKIEEELSLMDFMRLMQGVIIGGKANNQTGGPPNNEQPIVG